MIIDKFLDDFDWFRSYCDSLEYSGQVNPVDGVEYPGINIQIPVGICSDVISKLQRATGRRISSFRMFLRMTISGDAVPHQAHNDSTMGDYGCVIYLNREEHCAGGTSFVRHIDHGMEDGPTSKEEIVAWERDTNIPAKWEIITMADMVQNRAVIFEAKKMHRPEPPTGFGGNAKDGRLVLVCFFEVFK